MCEFLYKSSFTTRILIFVNYNKEQNSACYIYTKTQHISLESTVTFTFTSRAKDLQGGETRQDNLKMSCFSGSSAIVVNPQQDGLFSISQGHLEAAEEIGIKLDVTDSTVAYSISSLP